MTVCAMDATVRSASARPWHARSYRSSGKDVRTRLNRNRAYYYCTPLQKTADRTTYHELSLGIPTGASDHLRVHCVVLTAGYGMPPAHGIFRI